MKKLKKYKNSILYKEYGYILHGFLKRLFSFFRIRYRFFLNFKKRKFKKLLKHDYFHSENISLVLKNKIGHFEGYQVSADKKKDIISQAERILKHQFKLLGGSTSFPDKINWHKDFKSGFQWSKGKFYLRYKQVNLSNQADVKIPRELSRSHHLLTLGQAFLLTSDEKYANEFKSQIEDWIDENPLMYSINWGCTMDVSIRAANWIFALAMFNSSKIMDEGFIQKIGLSLFEHGWFINKNLEKSFKYNANHFDGDIGGLLLVGLLFQNTLPGSKWFEFSKYALFDEIRKQIVPSGMEYEKSTFYNRLVLEIFSYSIFILKFNGYQIPNDIEHRLWSMYKFISFISYIDNELPIIGDQDSARYLPFDKIYRNDIAYLLDIAYNYYEDPYFLKSNNNDSSEVFFFIRADRELKYLAETKIKNKSYFESKSFPDVGIFKIIHKDFFLLINNSSPGRFIDDPFATGSHAHADLLSFIMSKGSTRIFVDPGSFEYTSDYKLRNMFRTTSMHNTVNIDNQSQFKFNERELFDYLTRDEVKKIRFEEDDNMCLFEGEHNAYSHLGEGLIHSRQFLLLKQENRLIISDSITCEQEHLIELNFHLHPEIEVFSEKGEYLLKFNNNLVSKIKFEVEGFDLFTSVKNSHYSDSYGYIIDSKLIRASFKINRDCFIRSVISF